MIMGSDIEALSAPEIINQLIKVARLMGSGVVLALFHARTEISYKLYSLCSKCPT